MVEEVNTGYQVLARKYRPATFEDLIGQDVMVRTLKNAFAADRRTCICVNRYPWHRENHDGAYCCERYELCWS